MRCSRCGIYPWGVTHVCPPPPVTLPTFVVQSPGELLYSARDVEMLLAETKAERDVARAAADQWETRHNQLADAARLVRDVPPSHRFAVLPDLFALLDVDTGHTEDDHTP
jgi:hypothetical protein